jgi:hypothetical protein
MRLPALCSVCMIDNPESQVFAALHPTNDGRYIHTCERGHNSLTIIQQEQFQVLFEVGLHAIIDGYFREAVVDFASALERFYEFYFRMHCRSRGITRAYEDKTWLVVKSQSERQLGLYLCSYLYMNGECAPTLDDKRTNFRNAVIHKGYLPSKEEAIAFGTAAADIMLPIMQDLSTTQENTLNQMTVDRLATASRGEHAAVIFYPTFLDFRNEPPVASLEAAINRISTYRRRW